MNLLRLITARIGVSGVDPDAQAFITAAGITDPTQQSAIIQLVADLKGYSLWSKMKAVYPIVGGTASSHSYNLINPSQYQVTWYPNLTHSSTGITKSFSSGYGDTGLIPSSVFSNVNSIHCSVYSRTATVAIGHSYDIGTIDSTYTNGLTMILPYNDFSQFLFAINSAAWSSTSIVAADGLFCSSRTNSSSADLYRNTTSIATAGASTALSAYSVSLMGLNVGGSTSAFLSGTKEWAWFSIGDGLDATDVANLYSAVQAYQTTLGRQV